jgi:hypothetical protein
MNLYFAPEFLGDELSEFMSQLRAQWSGRESCCSEQRFLA